jgi:hypothetical protein
MSVCLRVHVLCANEYVCACYVKIMCFLMYGCMQVYLGDNPVIYK